MRILITGATGFIGTRLVERLSGEHQVIALCHREPPSRGASVDWRAADLSSPLDTTVLPEELDAVAHLAQSPRYREFPSGAADMFAVNVAATQSLLDHAVAAGARTFVLASTGGLYPFADGTLSEETPPAPSNFYFLSKYLSEQLLTAYAGLIAPVILRPFFVYGAGQKRMLIPTLIDRICAGEEITIDGDPGLRINPIHVSDAVRAFEAALKLGSASVLNVAGPDAIGVDDLVGRLADLLGREPHLIHRKSDRAGDLVASIDRMAGELGVKPLVRLADGLPETVGSAIAAADRG
jgi:UDP-glucose 4-epimerase